MWATFFLRNGGRPHHIPSSGMWLVLSLSRHQDISRISCGRIWIDIFLFLFLQWFITPRLSQTEFRMKWEEPIHHYSRKFRGTCCLDANWLPTWFVTKKVEHVIWTMVIWTMVGAILEIMFPPVWAARKMILAPARMPWWKKAHEPQRISNSDPHITKWFLI